MVRFCRTCHLPFPAGELQNLKVQDLLKWIGFQTSVEDVQSMVRRQPSLLHCYMLGVVWVAWVSGIDVDSITDSYIYIYICNIYIILCIYIIYMCVYMVPDVAIPPFLFLHLSEDLMHGMVTDGDRWCEESGFQSQQDHGHTWVLALDAACLADFEMRTGFPADFENPLWEFWSILMWEYM